ncbi:helix-turn-helix transcriptional regulator [Paenibacillus abyssi]|uniref:Transcriptional regulator n=1 Tax=Paenibacillus abyssi TaxID=1340531 RepID=A0A917G039_9BACL|nr:winged helix-turn-helix transcriptional regulator [Paenibacillus abyssi]GGG15795.1 transcriptional regulator [Paenibacillus abyssi]
MDGNHAVHKEGILRQDGSTRQIILTLLRTKGPSSTGELSRELGITEMGVRRHLNTLERDGYVRTSIVRQPMGRPSHLYGLTEAADGLFPKNYHVLALDLLEELEEVPELAGTVSKLFEGRKQKLLNRYVSRMQGKTLEQRVEELAAIQNSGGYMAQVESKEGELILHEYNCPIAQIANRYQMACHCELDLFEALLETPVERTECLAKGGGKCSYRISKLL